ncbi:MAG TPA: anti-sigma regulatory factor [Pyrinomonadaceae bacterium]|nr:anti-sigma regulatory factor [Pyrinomonadaceae bacterium]
MESRAISLETEHDIVVARGEVRAIADALGFRPIDQTRLATVTSELARNIVKYAGRGQVIAQPTQGADGREGLRLIFEDSGGGIADIPAAMRDGFSTGRGLGKGLPGSQRLVDEFKIESTPGRGTRITVVRWI